MRMKSFAILAMTGLTAASLAYVAPAMADNGSSMQAPSSDSTSTQNGSGTSQGSDNSMGSDNSSSSGSSDQGSPDTATGDDDY